MWTSWMSWRPWASHWHWFWSHEGKRGPHGLTVMWDWVKYDGFIRVHSKPSWAAFKNLLPNILSVTTLSWSGGSLEQIINKFSRVFPIVANSHGTDRDRLAVQLLILLLEPFYWPTVVRWGLRSAAGPPALPALLDRMSMSSRLLSETSEKERRNNKDGNANTITNISCDSHFNVSVRLHNGVFSWVIILPSYNACKHNARMPMFSTCNV